MVDRGVKRREKLAAAAAAFIFFTIGKALISIDEDFLKSKRKKEKNGVM